MRRGLFVHDGTSNVLTDHRSIRDEILEVLRIAYAVPVKRKWDEPRHIRSQRRPASDCHRPPLSRGFIDGGTDRPLRINATRDNQRAFKFFGPRFSLTRTPNHVNTRFFKNTNFEFSRANTWKDALPRFLMSWAREKFNSEYF